MYCSDNAGRLQVDNLLSFMLHEVLFLRSHSQFPSYPYSFTSYSYSLQPILQPYVVATLRMDSNKVFPLLVLPE